jgi:hypothetical protein
VQLRKVEHPNGKSFYWACNGPDCPYESEEIKYTATRRRSSVRNVDEAEICKPI